MLLIVKMMTLTMSAWGSIADDVSACSESGSGFSGYSALAAAAPIKINRIKLYLCV